MNAGLKPEKYSIWIISPKNYTHSHAFAEVALSLKDALFGLGYQAKIVDNAADIEGKAIILGANIKPDYFPLGSIIYNLEQICAASPWLTNHYMQVLRDKTFDIWDYSQANIDELARLGVSARLCEIGYSESLTHIKPVEKTIDVLHYGSVTPRRVDIINALADRGAKVHFLFGVYGAERDKAIAQSKIVLNIHFYESKVFEIVRCSYLMANKACVVSEDGNGGEEYADGICFSPYDKLVDSCMALLADEPKRLQTAQRGFEIFSRKDQVEILRGLL